MKAYAFTHVGQRDENQDRLTVLRSPGGDEFLLAVADGLGGHAGGALAAQTVIETVERCWNSRSEDADAENFLRRLVGDCHAAVNRAGKDAGLEPRSTLAALLGRGSALVSVHAGDSRVMQLSDTGLVKRTFDHSLGRLNVLRGVIAEEELATHPDQKKLFSHLGGNETPDAEYERWDPVQGARFVVCSDGFWEIFPPDEILAVFAASDPQAAIERRFAEKLGGLKEHDNTTAILAKVAAPRRLRSRFKLGALRRRAFVFAALPAAWRAAGLAAQVAGGEGREGGVERRAAPAPRPPESEQPPSAGGPVALDAVQLEVNRRIAPGDGVAQAAADELRRRGKIGPDDTLAADGKSREIAGKTIARLRQKHKGVSVYAGEVAAVVEDGRLVNIQGSAAPVSGVDPVPANDYPTTLALAGERLGQGIAARDEGAPVVFAVARGRFRLAWEGVTAIDGVEQRTVFDARTGEVLLRFPVTLDSGPDAPR